MTSLTGHRGSETNAVGRRVGATLVDTVLVFLVLYIGLIYIGGAGITDFAGWEPFVVLGFFFWFVFSVLAFAPLLVLHGYSSVWFFLAVGLWAAYATVFETAFGRTVGKAVFGLVVIADDGKPVTLRAAAIRNGLRVLDSLLAYFVGFVVIALTERRQRLGDLAAGTVVCLIHEPE